MKLNICCSDFNVLSEEEIFLINQMKINKIGFYLEFVKKPNSLYFPLYHIGDLCADKGINVCLDLESAYICSRISSNKRYLLINNFERLQNIKYEKLLDLIKKESILSHKQDILLIIEQLFNNKGERIDSVFNI